MIAPVCLLLAQPILARAAEEPLRISLIVPLTGGQASTGKQLANAVKLYQQYGDVVAGRKIDVIDGAIPERLLPDDTLKIVRRGENKEDIASAT